MRAAERIPCVSATRGPHRSRRPHEYWTPARLNRPTESQGRQQKSYAHHAWWDAMPWYNAPPEGGMLSFAERRAEYGSG